MKIQKNHDLKKNNTLKDWQLYMSAFEREVIDGR